MLPPGWLPSSPPVRDADNMACRTDDQLPLTSPLRSRRSLRVVVELSSPSPSLPVARHRPSRSSSAPLTLSSAVLTDQTHKRVPALDQPSPATIPLPASIPPSKSPPPSLSPSLKPALASLLPKAKPVSPPLPPWSFPYSHSSPDLDELLPSANLIPLPLSPALSPRLKELVSGMATTSERDISGAPEILDLGVVPPSTESSTRSSGPPATAGQQEGALNASQAESTPTASRLASPSPVFQRPTSSSPLLFGSSSAVPHLDLPSSHSVEHDEKLTSLPEAAILPQEATRVQIPTLRDIAQTLRQQKYHRRRCHQMEDNLFNLQIAAARTARLSRVAHSVRHSLAECIKSEDKSSFVNLLNVFLDSADACLKPSITASSAPGADAAEMASQRGRPSDMAPGSFLGELSHLAQVNITDFIARLRFDSDFLADRILSLSNTELLALLPPDHAASSSRAESVLGTSSRTSSRTTRLLGFIVDAQLDMLASQTFSCGLEALIFVPRGLRPEDALSGSACDARSTATWAGVCARLIAEQRVGSERIIPTVLDIWATLAPWPGKERLEMWMLNTLQQGSFLLEPSSKQTFRARMDARQDATSSTTPDEDRINAFYDNATDSLLDLLADPHGASVIPPGVLQLCESIFAQLSRIGSVNQHERALAPFVMSRWLFSPFFLDAITLPEAHDLLTDYYLSDNARQRILWEVAFRAKKSVLDVIYAWKHGNPIPSRTIQRVHAIMARFQQRSNASRKTSPRPASAAPKPTGSQDAPVDTFIALSITDVLQLIKALYPRRRPASCFSDAEPPLSRSGLQSSASSVSGLSLFRNNRMDSAVDTVFRPAQESLSPARPTAERAPDSSNESPGAQPLAQEDRDLRGALVELEEMQAARMASSEESWEILASCPSSRTVCTMSELFSRSSTPSLQDEDDDTNTESTYRLHHTSSAELQACTKSIKSLLQKANKRLDEIELSLQLPSATEVTRFQISSMNLVQVRKLFELKIAELEGQSDFVRAHSWFNKWQEFDAHFAAAAGESSILLDRLLEGIQTRTKSSITRAAGLSDACESWMRILKPRSQFQENTVAQLTDISSRLRDKMWYVANVRTSAAYDSARNVVNALRVMGKPKTSLRPRSTTQSLRHWSAPRLSYATLAIKSDAQMLEILSARPEHGGPNKLSDDQSTLTAQWLELNGIDNLCPGEERLHKLCMEVRKCADTVLAGSPTENSTILWSDPLFSRDPGFPYQPRGAPSRRPTLLAGLNNAQQHSTSSMLHHNTLRSLDAWSNTSRTPSSVTNRSSAPFWSPAMTEADLPLSSSTSVASLLTRSALHENSLPRRLRTKQDRRATGVSRQTTLDKLRQHTVSLVLSDLTFTIFVDGSETDRAFWSGLGLQLGEKHIFIPQQQLLLSDSFQNLTMSPSRKFDFDHAFTRLLAKFSAAPDPIVKLQCLLDIDKLLGPYMSERRPVIRPSTATLRSRHGNSDDDDDGNTSDSDAVDDFDGNDSDDGKWQSNRNASAAAASIRGFRALFSNSKYRPATIFRDLQYISALAPVQILQNSAQGRAFANAAMAISELKGKAKIVFVETADSIIAFHSNNRGHGRSPSTAQQQRDSQTFSAPSRSSSAEEIAHFTMADAATLLVIAAREGDPVAQRELATLYLTHPDLLMGPVIAPFTCPADVFRPELEAKWRKNSDPHRCDPMTMCVANHWMSLSYRRGDPLAAEYLRQREEMERLP